VAGKLKQVWIPTILQDRYGKTTLSARFENADDAKAWSAKERGRLAAEERIAKQGKQQRERLNIAQLHQITFRAASVRWLAAADVRDSTRRFYRDILNSYLLPRIGSRHVSEIGESEIRAHFAARKAQRATHTKSGAVKRKAGASGDALKRDLIVLRAVLGWARDAGYEVDATAWKVTPPKVTPTITRRFDPDATQRFVESVKGQDRTVLQVAAMTGMRAGEIRAFAVEWIRWDEGRIAIPADEVFSPKSRKPRSVPLFPELEAVLREHLGQRERGAVFAPARSDGRGVHVRAIVKRARKASGVDFTNLHDLRHHYLSHLAHHGVKLKTIQEIAGHSHIGTTQRYLHVSPDYLAEARAALESSSESSSAKKSRGSKKRSARSGT
jgi:integrase